MTDEEIFQKLDELQTLYEERAQAQIERHQKAMKDAQDAFVQSKAKYIRLIKEAGERAVQLSATVQSTNHAIDDIGHAALLVVASLRCAESGTFLERSMRFSQRVAKLENLLESLGYSLDDVIGDK